MWLVAIGLGDLAPMFRSAAVDGGLLTDLGEEDFKEVGCTGLQGKKIMRCLEISCDMATGGGYGTNDAVVQQLQAENAQLRAEISRLQSASQPAAYAPAPAAYAPAPAPPQQQKPKPVGHPVVAGAAGGALKGAVVGAVGGAIMGDPGKGAKVRLATCTVALNVSVFCFRLLLSFSYESLSSFFSLSLFNRWEPPWERPEEPWEDWALVAVPVWRVVTE